MLTQTAAILIEQQQKLYYALVMVTQKLDSEMRRMTGLHHGSLTIRQHEVLALVRVRRSNKEIGHQLHISENTVRYHVGSLLAKFGAQNRTDLILSTGEAK